MIFTDCTTLTENSIFDNYGEKLILIKIHFYFVVYYDHALGGFESIDAKAHAL